MDVLPSSASHLAQIYLLGSYRLLVQGQCRAQIINYDKARILLSILALAQGKPISRSRLAETIWHEDPISVGRARLRHALHALRRAFEGCDQALHITNDTLALDPNRAQVDVLSLLQHPSQPALSDLERLNLYQGPLLGQVKLHHGEQLQDWLQDTQHTIRQTLSQCRDRYIQSGLRSLPTPQAISYLKRWLVIWPEEEKLHQELIRLLKQEGQHEAALHAYEQCSVLLADRLGCEPSAQTRNLVDLPVRSASSPVKSLSTKVSLQLRPLAAVGLCLRFEPSHRHARERGGQLLEQSRQTLRHLIEQHGAWPCEAGPNQLIAYFGYPELLESPITQAVVLARVAATLRLDEHITLSIALHADLAMDEQSACPDPWGQLAQVVLPLSWQAAPGAPRISAQAALRLASKDIQPSAGRQNEALWLNLSPSDTDHARLTSRVYGRSQEFDHLVQAWSHIGSNRTLHHIAIHGRAHIGKSLLVQSLADYVQKTAHPCIMLTCREDKRRVAWHPIRLWLHEQIADYITSQNGKQHDPFSVQILQETLEISPKQAQSLHQWLNHGPEEQELNEPSTAHMDLLFNLLSGTGNSPRRRLLIIENVQWADPPTQRLIRLLAHTAPRHPTLLLTTSRKPGHGLERAEHLSLPTLDRSSINSLLSNQRGQRLARDKRSRLVKLSAGNPGHAHELLRCHELNSECNDALCLTDLICTQYHSLLPATRHILTSIALQEEPIAIDELALMLRLEGTTLSGGLDTLATLDLIDVHDKQVSCLPLVSQALKRVAMHEELRQAHYAIAQHGIRRRHAPEQIAWHLCEADSAEAAFWWQRAAREALAQDDLRQASQYLQRCLNRSDLIDDLQVRQTLQFECRMLQGAIESSLYGPASASTAMAYELGHGLHDEHDSDQVMISLWTAWTAFQAQGNFEQALQKARQLLALANETSHDQNRSWALYAIGQHELWKGNVTNAIQTLNLSLAVFDDLKEQNSRQAIAQHFPQSITFGTLSVALALKGNMEAAQQHTHLALQSLRSDTAFSLRAITHLFVMQAHYLMEQLEHCQQVAELSLQELQRSHNPEPWSALSRSYLHYCQVMLHGRETSLQSLLDCVQTAQYGLPISTDGLMCRIARAMIRLGRSNEAMPWLDKAAAQGLRYDTNSLRAELHCVRGDAWMALGENAQALQEWNLAEQHMEKYGLHRYTDWIQTRRQAVQRLKV
ncbi:MAG: AAA family ATPase [Alcaligenes aquatilis]|uniref:AAA family ATPase n=1 Tax=Alcaligenes aquatilis TaxID=323284 RepID=UPI0037519B87